MRDDDAVAYRRAMEVRLRFWGGVLLRIALLIAGVYIVWRVRAVLTVVIVSLIVACAVAPIVDALCQHRLTFLKPHQQRLLASSFVFIALLGILFVGGKLFLAPFQHEFHKLVRNWPVYQHQLEVTFTRARDWYAALPPDVRAFLDQQQDNLSVPSPSSLFADFGKRTVSIASHAVEFFLIPVLAFYFTVDTHKLRKQFFDLVPRNQLRQTIAILQESGSIMRAYIISQFWLAVIAGTVVTAALKMIGMDYALILGLFAGITRAIPVIGPFIGAVPLVLLTFAYGAQTGNPYLWVGATLAFSLMHVIETKFVMPQFLGKTLKLHPVMIIIALLIGGEFFGLMGMFLAAPVAALIRVLLDHYIILPNRRVRPVKSKVDQSDVIRIPRLERAIRTARKIPASLSPTTVTLTGGFSKSENAGASRD